MQDCYTYLTQEEFDFLNTGSGACRANDARSGTGTLTEGPPIRRALPIHGPRPRPARDTLHRVTEFT